MEIEYEDQGMMIENEGESEVEEKIAMLKSILQLFTIILPEKSNERNIVFNQINDSFLEHSKVFLKTKLSLMKNYDCRSYLMFARKLRKLDKELFNRIFEDNESMSFIHKNLDDIFYHRVLRKYIKELVKGEFGFVWLLKKNDFEVFFFLINFF